MREDRNDAYYINKLREQADITALLEELSDYFDGKQDCEIFTDTGYSPNAEMGFFLRIQEILEGTK